MRPRTPLALVTGVVGGACIVLIVMLDAVGETTRATPQPVVRHPTPTPAVTRTLGTVLPAAPPIRPASAPSAAPLVVRGTGTNHLTVRRSPGGERVGALGPGEQVIDLDQRQVVDGQPWRKVRTPDGVEGWVAAEYLALAPTATAETPTPTPTPHGATADAAASATAAPTTGSTIGPWSMPSTPASPSPAPATGPVAPRGGDCPPTHPVKGSQLPPGEPVYYVRGDAFYDVTRPDACYATAADAQAAGYRPGRR